MALNKTLDEIKELLQENQKSKKKKEFKIPFTKRVTRSQKARDFVTIMRVNENGSIHFEKEQIQDQTVMIDQVPRLATSKYIYHWKKNPIMILPSWSIEPFCAEKDFKDSLKDGRNKNGYRLILNKMETETTGMKKKMGKSVGWIMAVVVGGIIAYALVTGGAS